MSRISRTLYERVEPLLHRKPLWGQAAELPEFRDHIGLVGITQFPRDPGLVNVLAASGVCQPRFESCKPAAQIGRNADAVAEYLVRCCRETPAASAMR